MAEVARYYDPKTRFIETMTAEEAGHRGWKPFPEGEGPEFEAEDTYPKHTGGGYYELSNGQRVQGKEAAEAAEAELKED